MAEKPVIVPVELQVTELDMSKVDVKNVEKDVTQKLSGLKKTISDIFSGIDTTKMSKSITSSMSAVEKSVSRVLSIYAQFETAYIQAGKSSEVYKSKVEDITHKVKELQGTLHK